MKRILTLAGVAVVAGGAIAGYMAFRESPATTVASTKAVTLATAEVAQKDLVVYNSTTATLGYRTTSTINAPVAGTLTSIAGVGTEVRPGTVIATVDGVPVVALLGDVPVYRALKSGVADGIDVRQLETNLVLLGFDPDSAITIDDHFDTADTAAIKLWQASLGVTVDGVVPAGSMAFIQGEMRIDTVEQNVGAAVSAGTALVSGPQTLRSFLIPATFETAGAISGNAASSTAVTTGTVLFREREIPVVAIVGDYATTPALTRDLSVGVDDGLDVRLLETMLKTVGADPNNAMTVDDHFDDATAAAVARWWLKEKVMVKSPDATDWDPDEIVVPSGSFVVVPSGLQAGDPLVSGGTAVAGDAVVLGLTSPARQITTSASVGDTTLALGSTMTVVFPDGTEEPGTVTDVGTVATAAGNQPGATPSVPITVGVDEVPDSVSTFSQIPVTLKVVTDEAKGALVVPVSALVALAEGGFAVEVVDGATDATATTSVAAKPATHLVGVTPGLYADGFVSITATGLSAGQKVVVPS